jgi:hypothetical protein
MYLPSSTIYNRQEQAIFSYLKDCIWNIVQNPDLLVAKVIKVGYFRRSSLFEAFLGYNPWFAWRSIWKTRQVLLIGFMWSIGGGGDQ